MPALSSHDSAAGFGWSDCEQDHVDWPGARRTRTGFETAIRPYRRQNFVPMVRRILRTDRDAKCAAKFISPPSAVVFPAKLPAGAIAFQIREEIQNCSSWMNDEFAILRPHLVIPVGRLAIARFIAFVKLEDVIGRSFPMQKSRCSFDLIPLPHPSGVSPWHKIPPGKKLLGKAMRLIAAHPAVAEIKRTAKGRAQ